MNHQETRIWIRFFLTEVIFFLGIIGFLIICIYFGGIKYHPLQEKVRDMEWRVERLEAVTGVVK